MSRASLGNRESNTMNAEIFLAEMAETANTHNFDAHMNLISKDVKVYGVPKFDLINYNDWFNQCKKEFEDKLLLRVSYDGVHTLSETSDEITFIVVEYIEASDGHQNFNGAEFTIRKEADGCWRLVLQRITTEQNPGTYRNLQ